MSMCDLYVRFGEDNAASGQEGCHGLQIADEDLAGNEEIVITSAIRSAASSRNLLRIGRIVFDTGVVVHVHAHGGRGT